MYMLFKLFKLFIIKKNSNNLFGLMFNKLSYIYIYIQQAKFIKLLQIY